MAASGPRWRRKHMMTWELMPSLARAGRQRVADAGERGEEGDAALGVALRVEEQLDVRHAVGRRALQVRPGQVVEVLQGHMALHKQTLHLNWKP